MPLRIFRFDKSEDVVAFVNAAQKATNVAVDSGGVDYAVNDILTVVGGDGPAPVRLEVTNVGGGSGTAVLTAVVLEEGALTDPLPNPVAVTGGSGTGAEFNLTLADAVTQGDEEDIIERDSGWYLGYWV